MVKEYIESKKKEKDILIMTHLVAGYPSFDDSYRLVETMVSAGVDLIEIQIPFSDCVADGKVILNANYSSLNKGTTPDMCFEFSKRVTSKFNIPFIFTTYYNIIYAYGIHDFFKKAKECGIKGIITADLPPEEADDYISECKNNAIAPIFMISPSTSEERMRYIDNYSNGFIYATARKGVTGKHTDFSDGITLYLSKAKNNIKLPLAVGFGISEKSDLDFLKGKADIAVIGTKTIKVFEEEGLKGVENFIKSLK